jgi:hypothetical protein
VVVFAGDKLGIVPPRHKSSRSSADPSGKAGRRPQARHGSSRPAGSGTTGGFSAAVPYTVKRPGSVSSTVAPTVAGAAGLLAAGQQMLFGGGDGGGGGVLTSATAAARGAGSSNPHAATDPPLPPSPSFGTQVVHRDGLSTAGRLHQRGGGGGGGGIGGGAVVGTLVGSPSYNAGAQLESHHSGSLLPSGSFRQGGLGGGGGGGSLLGPSASFRKGSILGRAGSGGSAPQTPGAAAVVPPPPPPFAAMPAHPPPPPSPAFSPGGPVRQLSSQASMPWATQGAASPARPPTKAD